MDLRKRIDDKGLKHGWVAQRLGIHKTALSQYLSKIRETPEEVKSKIIELTK
jgi:predicted transcriptional regulator